MTSPEGGQEAQPQMQPSIWVGSWLDYNNGVLHGRWMAADREQAEIAEDIAAILAESPTARSTGDKAEEWGIFDYDNFGILRLGESEDLEFVSRVARGIAEHGSAFAAWVDNSHDIEAGHDFADSYRGHFESVEAYIDEMISDFGYDRHLDEAVPDTLRPYVRIDTAMLARDMQIDGSFTAVNSDDGGVWIFV